MTARGDTGHQKTSLKDQMTFVNLVNTGSLPNVPMNSVIPSTLVSLQVVQENKSDIQQIKTILLELQGLPTHVNFESQFYQKHYEKKRIEIVNRIMCRKYFDIIGKVFYQQAKVPDECMKKLFLKLHEEIMQGHPGSKKILYHLRQKYYCPNKAA